MGKAPGIRFSGFTDDWEQRKLGEVFKERSERANGDEELLSVTIGNGVIRQIDSDKRDTASEDKSNYKIVKKGDVPYNSMRMWQGAVGNSEYDGIVSPAYTVLIPTEEANGKFFMELFKKESTLQIFQRWSQGLTSDTWNLKYPALSIIQFYMPSVDEQNKIAEYFESIDNLITFHQRKFDALATAKKYYLQNMFPEKGETKPRIRFAGFTDDWEQRKFGDLADYKKGPFGSAITKNMFVPKSDDSIKVYEQQNAINKDWSLERYYLPKEYALTKLKSFEVHGGDIIVSCAGTIGEIYEIPENAESGVINQALMRVRVNENIVEKNMFIISFSNMIDDFTRAHSNGSAIKNIPPFADLKPMEVLMPSIEEQRIISGFFSDLDNLIMLHQRKRDELQDLKKFMLQNMFV